jgi:hypothetical protein
MKDWIKFYKNKNNKLKKYNNTIISDKYKNKMIKKCQRCWKAEGKN